MTLTMTEEERQTFLAGLHVGVIAIERPAGPPLAVPIWYDYEPGGDVVLTMRPESIKGILLAKAGRASLCAQSEEPPFYKYVSVEGPMRDLGPADDERQIRPLATRYFGEELASWYMDNSDHRTSHWYALTPQRWFSLDYAKSAPTQ